MKQYEQILFVDKDDTTRGVMACQLMRREELYCEPRIDSRGLIVLFPEPVNPKAEKILDWNALAAQGHEARQLTEEDIRPGTLVLTMEEAQKEKVREIAPNAGEVYTICEYAGIGGNIEELFAEDLPVYAACFELMEKLVKLIATKINEEETWVRQS